MSVPRDLDHITPLLQHGSTTSSFLTLFTLIPSLMSPNLFEGWLQSKRTFSLTPQSSQESQCDQQTPPCLRMAHQFCRHQITLSVHKHGLLPPMWPLKVFGLRQACSGYFL